ncbi:MAG: transglutaminase-like domain-containing protein [Anaerolineales bacterium]|nr:transglutaminase-like domain-containing protein [Anaerolineales bacterium]
MGKTVMIYDLSARSFSWILNKIGIYTLISLIMLVVILNSLSVGLQTAVPILRNYSLLFYTTTGLIIGLLFSRSSLDGWKVIIISVVLGMIIIFIDLSQSLIPILDLIRETINIVYQSLSWPWNGPPDVEVFQILFMDIATNIKDVLLVLYLWIQSIARSNSTIKSSGSILLWLLNIWAASIWAGWAVRRIKNPIISIIPAGLLLAAVLNYVRKDTYLILLILMSTLIMTAFVEYKSREMKWENKALDYPEDIRIDFTFTIVVTVFVFTSLAFITPSLSIKSIAITARLALSAQKDKIEFVADSLGFSDQYTSEIISGGTQTPALPRSHLLGSNPDLSRNVVMIVKIIDVPVNNGTLPEFAQTGYYWRGFTYDIYNGQGWTTSQVISTSYNAGDYALQEINPTQQIIKQDFQITNSIGGRLFSAGTLLTADTDFQIARRSPNDIFGALIESPTYQVTSLVNQTSETQLLSSSQEYPDWVLERYLNLPKELPNRVIQLALDLTEEQPTAYAQAIAIEAYLRSYPYTLDIPFPPKGQDVTDYFLFDLQKGYCDYYATSMVVLARAAGLPSRLVVGYGSGLFDYERNRYIVTEADAHSWVEIYFPEFGWIEFEPTGGLLPLERPASLLSEYLPGNSNYDALVQIDPEKDKYTLWRLFPFTSITIGAIIIAIILILDERSFHQTEPAKVVNILYRRILLHGQYIDVPTSSSDTPNEFSLAMKEKIDDLLGYFPSDLLSSKINRNLSDITNLYVQLSYSPHPVRKVDQSNAIQSWHHVRIWLLIARITNLGRRIFQRIPQPKIQ